MMEVFARVVNGFLNDSKYALDVNMEQWPSG